MAGSTITLPDAEVLLSDTFLADHCFKIQPRNGRTAPADRTCVPADSGAQEAEYRGSPGLAGRPPSSRHSSSSTRGCLTKFCRSTTGAPFRSSACRAAAGSYEARASGCRSSATSALVSGTTAAASRWAAAHAPTRTHFGRRRGGAAGRAAQSGGARGRHRRDRHRLEQAVAGITVALEGTGDSTITAMDGTFELPFVQPGSYTIVLRHPALDTLGVRHFARTVEVEAGARHDVALRLPTNDGSRCIVCQAPVDFTNQSVIRFLVVDQAGAPVANTAAIFRARSPMRRENDAGQHGVLGREAGCGGRIPRVRAERTGNRAGWRQPRSAVLGETSVRARAPSAGT